MKGSSVLLHYRDRSAPHWTSDSSPPEPTPERLHAGGREPWKVKRMALVVAALAALAAIASHYIG
jgi:hypothetical protein